MAEKKPSFLDRICGKTSPKQKPATTADAIQKLREMERLLETKQEHLESKIATELKLAKANAAMNKRLALQALKRKKRLEKQLQQVDGTLATIELQREALEGANTNTTVLNAMKYAADALKNAHQTINVDKVHDMMDDIAEQQELTQEITDAISNPTTFSNYDVDEEELEKELEELNQQLLDKELLEAGPSPVDLPSVPATVPSHANQPQESSSNQDEEELKNLLQWAT